MKIFGLISAGNLGLASTINIRPTSNAGQTTAPFTFDDEVIDFADLYGPLEVAKSVQPPPYRRCCSTLKMWGDIALFTGRFDKTDEEYDSFPVYKASRGDLKLFFNSYVNRWIVSTDTDDFFVRALGGSTSCPDDETAWKVWQGAGFEKPELIEPWSPYVESNKMFECRPDAFEVSDLSNALSTKFCNFIKSTNGVHSERLCREGHRVLQLAFGDWKRSTDNFLDSNILMTVRHIQTLDQWHAVLNSIVLKRTWESEHEVVTSIKTYIRSIVSEVRELYKDEVWAQSDDRFIFLQA